MRSRELPDPAQLFERYEVIMREIKEGGDESVRKASSWIYRSKSPLVMEELLEAIALGDEEANEKDWMRADDLIEGCGSLIVYDTETRFIRLCHYLVYRFF